MKLQRMPKDKFVEVLKHEQFPAALEDGVVTISLVGATHETLKETFFQAKLLANKCGYNHSIRVVNLKEEREDA